MKAVDVPASEKRTALVVGNGSYPQAPLKNPINDVRAIADVLRLCGFEVMTKENIGGRELVDAITTFGKKLQGGGTGLFYYAGHGMQVDGKNYLIPVDAKIEKRQDVEFEAVDVGRVLGEMDAARNRVNIVILDACRDNPFARSWRSTSAERGLAFMNAPSGTFIGYATAPGEIAADGAGQNGLFTEELITNIQIPGLTIEEVFKQTRVGVQGKSYRKQTPWDASSLTGNFYFNPSELSSAEKIPKNEEPKIKTSEEPQVKIKVPTKTDDMMWVEGGWFEMGSNDGSSDEKPVHRVYIDGFYIGKYEVSQSEYEKVMGTNPSNYKCPTCPVDYVTYNEAIIFANKVGKRLPTEAEWEYAARGGGKSNNYKFSGSDNLDDVGWYYSNAGGRTHAVGTKRANELGIYDMSGNVWEWCSDFYGWSYYEGSAEKNPQGPSSGTDRMLRGGSFLNSDFFVRCRATGRNWCEPNCRSTDYGFRCVQDEKIRVEDEVKKKVGEGLKKLFKKP